MLLFIIATSTKNYRKFLKKRYRKSSLPHDEKLFFDDNAWRRYIELAIIKKDDKTSKTVAENILRGKSVTKDTPIVTLNDILEPDGGDSVQLVLIEGESGIGKTTLAWQLCHKWAKKELDSVKEYDLVILVPLREKRAQTAKEAEDLLLYDEESNKKEVRAAIGRGEGVLIVCDGFDELPSEQLKESSVYARLFRGEVLSEATVVVTTRPSASAEFKRVCKQRIDRKVEITGFTEAGIREFAESIFTNHDDLSGFLSYLDENLSIYNLMYRPLSAIIVAKIYQEDYKAKKKTMSQLFDAFTRVLIRRYLLSKYDEEVAPIKFPLTSLKNIDNLPNAMAPHFRKIAKMAYDGICANEYIFDDPESDEKFENLELMRKVERRNVHGPYYIYVFFHHTLQEYMAAIHIATILSDELASLGLQLKEKDMITRFLAGICHTNRYKHSHGLLKWLVKFLGGNCYDRSGALLLVHCAYECPSIMDKLKVLYSKENPFTVVEPVVGTDWYAMGYCISHFDEKWGLCIHATDSKNIGLLEKGLKSSPPHKSAPIRLKYLYMSRSNFPTSLVSTNLEEFCQLQCLGVGADEDDEKACVYNDDLPALTSLIESLRTLQVLELGQIVDYDTSNANPNLHKLVEVAVNRQLEKLKLHKVDYKNLPQHLRENPIILC